MKNFRFDMKLVFVVITNFCVIVWGLNAMAHRSDWFLLVPAVTAFSGALYAGNKIGRAAMLGALGGAIGAAALPLAMCVLNDIGYFFHTGSGEYFEDGAFAEVVIYPIVYLLTWGPLGAIFGMFIGLFVAAFFAVKSSATFSR